MPPIWETFAPFDEDLCVWKGFVVAMDERGWMFKFSFAEGSFEIFVAGFQALAMSMWD